MTMPTSKETLAEAKRHLKVNLSLLKQLKGNTPNSMLADFRLRYVKPLEELIEHLEAGVHKDEKAGKVDGHMAHQGRQSRKKK